MTRSASLQHPVPAVTPPASGPGGLPGPTARAHRTPSAHLSRRHLLTLAPLAAALLAGCGSDPAGVALTSDVTREEVALSDATKLAEAVAACDVLGAAMLTDAMAEAQGANTVASPLSLALALALVADGASDPAAQGYDHALGASGEERDRAWSAIQTSVNRNDGDLEDFDPAEPPAQPLVHVANHVVVVDDAEVEQSYLDTVARWYTALIERVERGDLSANLDAWVRQHTAGLIKKSAVVVTDELRLVLQNAVLFAARWDSPFEEKHTSAVGFTVSDGSTVQVDRMHQELYAPYAEGEGWRAVRLAYSGPAAGPEGPPDQDGLVLDVVLPETGTGPAELDGGTWAQASAALDEVAGGAGSGEAGSAGSPSAGTLVRLGLPKLDLTPPTRDLLPLLDDLGLALGPLDLMGKDLQVGQVAQQTRLIVDEEGTVAAAVTEVGLAATAAPAVSPVEFLVDRPYVLRLRDLASGVALFEAVVMDPTVRS